MRATRLLAFISLCVLTLFLAAQRASGQQSATGLDQFGTYHRNHIQTINLFNLNNHIEIPFFAKKERGIDFYAKLVWDQSDSLQIVQNPPGSPPGQHFELSYSQLATPGGVRYNSHVVGSQTCVTNTSAVTTYFDSIVDQNNTVHALPYNAVGPMGQYCGSGTWTIATNDGKYLLNVTWTDQNCWGEQCITSVTETDTSGNVYANSVTDPNGNQITPGPNGLTDPQETSFSRQRRRRRSHIPTPSKRAAWRTFSSTPPPSRCRISSLLATQGTQPQAQA